MIQLKVVAEIQCDRCGRATTATADTKPSAIAVLTDEGWTIRTPFWSGPESDLCAACGPQTAK